MHDCVVQTSAPEGKKEEILILPSFGKEIERERGGETMDDRKRLFLFLIGEDGKYRSEDFLLHDLIMHRYIPHQGRFNLQVALLATSPIADLVLVDQGLDPLKMLGIDDVAAETSPILFEDFVLHQCDEFFLHLLVDQKIVGGDACLPHVEELPEDDSTGSHL